jgi:xanthine dehydrogenase YagS FAD-binding subunit
MLTGKPPHRDVFWAAAEKALEGANGYGHNDFKIEMAKRSVVRAFGELSGGAA